MHRTGLLMHIFRSTIHHWALCPVSPIPYAPAVLSVPLHTETCFSRVHNVESLSVQVIDVSTGEPVGPNKEGELLVKGPQVMHNKATPTVRHRHPVDAVSVFAVFFLPMHARSCWLMVSP